jgi:hypothetical protein
MAWRMGQWYEHLPGPPLTITHVIPKALASDSFGISGVLGAPAI